MSFATALLDLAGGYGRGREQRFQNEQQQRQLTDEEKRAAQDEAYRQAQVSMEQQAFQQQQQDELANRGIDWKTGQPFVLPKDLQQVVPHNPITGKQDIPIDPSTGKPYVGGSPQQQLAHLYTYANFLHQRGDQVGAQQAMDQAKAIQTELLRQQGEAAQLQRTMLTIAGEDRRADITDKRQRESQAQREEYEAWLRGQPTYRDLHPTTGKPASPESIAKSTATFYGDWQKATKPGHLKYPELPAGPANPMVGAPPVSPKEQAAASHVFSSIDAAPDPIAAAQKYAALTPNATLKELFFKRAALAAAKKGSFAIPGGSDDSQNPPDWFR